MKQHTHFNETQKDSIESSSDRERPHLPEWNTVFRELREEALTRHPDGRLRVIIPEHLDHELYSPLEDLDEAK